MKEKPFLSRELLSYFGLTYVLTWLFTIPFVLLWRTTLHQTLPWWRVVFLPGAFGLSIAALLLTWRRGGRPAVDQMIAESCLFTVTYLLLIPRAERRVEATDLSAQHPDHVGRGAGRSRVVAYHIQRSCAQR